MPLPLAQLGSTLLAMKLRNQQALDAKAAQEAQFQAEMAAKNGMYLDRGQATMGQAVRDIGQNEYRQDVMRQQGEMQEKSLAEKRQEAAMSREMAIMKLEEEKAQNRGMEEYRSGQLGLQGQELGLRGEAQTFDQLLGGIKLDLDRARLDEEVRWHKTQPSLMSMRFSTQEDSEARRIAKDNADVIDRQLRAKLGEIKNRTASGLGKYSPEIRGNASKDAKAALKAARDALQALSEQFPGVVIPGAVNPPLSTDEEGGGDATDEDAARDAFIRGQ